MLCCRILNDLLARSEDFIGLETKETIWDDTEESSLDCSVSTTTFFCRKPLDLEVERRGWIMGLSAERRRRKDWLPLWLKIEFPL